MNFLDFINEKRKTEEAQKILLEGFSDKSIDKAMNSVDNILKKTVSKGRVYRYSMRPYLTKINGEDCLSYAFGVLTSSTVSNIIMISFKGVNGSNEAYSISIFDSDKVIWEGKDKAKTTIYTMGASIAYFLPLIAHIINSKDYKVGAKDVEKYAGYVEQNLSKTNKKREGVKESYRPYHFGAITYNVFEGLDLEYINKKFFEASELENAKKELHQKRKELMPQAKELGQSWRDLERDYYAIVKAIKGGAENISDLDIEFKSNITVEILQGKEDSAAQSKLDKEAEKRLTPDQQWKEMRLYVNMVIKGIQPSVIICGAPGLGKTFKIRQMLKAKGFTEGQNLWTIKGKCSPRQLYLALYNFQRKGDIVMIDDADGLVGPHAPEDVINILKAALDSTSDDEGRLVSYMVSGDIKDDDGTPIPKKFYYNGGVIVITNYTAGQLDTALRGRSYVQDIHFTIEEIMQQVRDLMPTLGQREGISNESKQKAYEYMEKLVKDKAKIELSIRTFNACAKFFDAAKSMDESFTDEEINIIIGRNLKNQALRGGKKY